MNPTEGPMENILDGLDRQAQLLSKQELEAELRSRGIDTDAFLKRAHDITKATQPGQAGQGE
jgi:hypothetical protein